jgi:hypothetical protein
MIHRGIPFGVCDCSLPFRISKLPVTASGSLFPRNGWTAEAKLGWMLPLRALLGGATAGTVGSGWAHGHDRKENDDGAGRSVPQSHLAVHPSVADRSRTIPSSRPSSNHRRRIASQARYVPLRARLRLGSSAAENLRAPRDRGPLVCVVVSAYLGGFNRSLDIEGTQRDDSYRACVHHRRQMSTLDIAQERGTIYPCPGSSRR